ncbi:hypothetical protein B0H10DRAFT_13836 [Mycena sp. CBHHK59/15]|nr:hypothetical protein B0H10DRAFT_13836 [Mycena sp. CBHHK59/15]
MKKLRGFHWNAAYIQPSDDIWTALQALPDGLESLKVHSVRPRGENDVPDKWFLSESPLWKFSNLTSFSFAVSSLTSSYHAKRYISQLADMLNRCPMLMQLELMLVHDQPSDLLAVFQGRWPHLTKFCLGGPQSVSSASIPLASKFEVQNFFEAHSSITTLYLSINLASPDSVPDPFDVEKLRAGSFGIYSLPSLQLLHVPRNIFSAISPTIVMPELRHLRVVEASPSYIPTFTQLAQGAPNLTSIGLRLDVAITMPEIKAFLATIPGLERLYFYGGAPHPWVPVVPVPHAFYHDPLFKKPLAWGTKVLHRFWMPQVRTLPRNDHSR